MCTFKGVATLFKQTGDEFTTYLFAHLVHKADGATTGKNTIEANHPCMPESI